VVSKSHAVWKTDLKLAPFAESVPPNVRTLSKVTRRENVRMILRARGVVRGVFYDRSEVATIALLWGLLFVLATAIGPLTARNRRF
jgi:hypothetical protein